MYVRAGGPLRHRLPILREGQSAQAMPYHTCMPYPSLMAMPRIEGHQVYVVWFRRLSNVCGVVSQAIEYLYSVAAEQTSHRIEKPTGAR